MTGAVQEQGSLRSRAVRASTWSVGGFVAAQMLRMVSSLLLTRLLAPELFGLMAITTIVQTTFGLLSDLGLRQAVVQNPRGTQPAFLDTIWGLQVIRGLLIWVFSTLTGVVLFVLAKAAVLRAESVYAEPILPVLLFATGAVIFVDAFYSPKAHLAQRLMSLREVTIIDIVCQVGGLVVTLAFAWWLRSIWAIVIGGFASAFLHVWLTHAWLPGPRSRLKMDRQISDEIVRFGRWIVVSSSLGIFASNADRFLLGSWVTPEVLGFYAVALSLFTVLIGAGDKMLSGIVFPMLSEAARDGNERFRALYRKLHLPTDLIYLFASGGLFASAEWVVRLLFDPRYEPAGGMLKILALSLVLAKYGLAGNAYLAQGRTAWLSAINAVNLVGAWTIIPLMFHLYGLNGALLGIALRSLPMLPLTLYFNSQLKINDWKVEFGSLLAWPAGYAAGYLLTVIGASVR
jgi:O-antigen/teichoic acid export membrane protein